MACTAASSLACSARVACAVCACAIDSFALSPAPFSLGFSFAATSSGFGGGFRCASMEREDGPMLCSMATLGGVSVGRDESSDCTAGMAGSERHARADMSDRWLADLEEGMATVAGATGGANDGKRVAGRWPRMVPYLRAGIVGVGGMVASREATSVLLLALVLVRVLSSALVINTPSLPKFVSFSWNLSAARTFSGSLLFSSSVMSEATSRAFHSCGRPLKSPFSESNDTWMRWDSFRGDDTA
mmetsp:Transcript_9856/g.24606  ORF Transcript_9856/g.24606 Transcript_9856/m.24606 type:complete len:244 (+) Transcript_9856:621-1352(+)